VATEILTPEIFLIRESGEATAEKLQDLFLSKQKCIKTKIAL
jgi:hypothetical protein